MTYTPRINYDPATRRFAAAITDGNTTISVGLYDNYYDADVACLQAIARLGAAQ